MQPRDGHLRHGYEHPNEVNRHNQHAHWTRERLGNTGGACSIECGDQEKEREREDADQQKQVTAEHVSHSNPTALFNQIKDSLANGVLDERRHFRAR